jgi:TonB-linked SusC/RagA family outer membrane protein
MKLTVLIMLIALMQVSARTVAQKVTLSANAAPLSAVFDQISTQTGYDFAYTGSMLAGAKPVTIHVKNADLKEALKQIFDDQPLDYTIGNKSVVISLKEPPVPDKLKSSPNLDKIDVHGRVFNEIQPLPGATVIIKGTTNSTITDAKGQFLLKNVDPGATVVITFIGYAKAEIAAKPDLGFIILKTAENTLDQIQVIAYGNQTERLNVGNVTSVSAKTISETPATNPLIALQGQVAGLFISANSGTANGTVSVNVQGQNSLTSGTSPFFVIDGVPYISSLPQVVGTGNYGTGTATASPLAFINPDDIESISILKDAAATAVYGSRAANGAILITTKKGKAGAASINFDVQEGLSNVTKYASLLNAQQYLQMRRQAFQNDGLPVPSITTSPLDANYDVNGFWDINRNTDWQKALFGGTGHFNNVNGSVSGGSSGFQYLISGNYNRQTTVYPGDFNDKKANLHVNLSNTSVNQKFKMTFSASYMFDDDQLPYTQLTNAALSLPPDAPALYNADGSLNWALTPSGTNSWTNPLAALLSTYENKTKNLVSNLVLNYQLLPGLNINSSFGYTDISSNELEESPLSAIAPPLRATSTNSAIYGTTDINSWIIEPKLSYDKTIGKGKLSALLGSTINQQNSDDQKLTGKSYASDAVLGSIQAASTVSVTSYSQSVYRYNALFGRLNYVWDDKYIVDLSGRRDGSSRFGSANQFQNFWAVGGGWVFSQENVIKQDLPILSFGKLRASYGTTGNDQIGDYRYLSTYTASSPAVPYQNVAGLTPSGFPNPYLQWELTKKFSAGIDIGLLKDRILLGATYSDNRSSNLLLGYALPTITGGSSVTENFPATIRNYDWEFTLNTVNIKTDNFSWKTAFNLTLPTNKLVSFPNLATSSYASLLVIGDPINITRTIPLAGVNPTTGLYQFAGAGGLTSSPSPGTGPASWINTNPKFYGGLSNSFTYKSFQLDFFLQFQKKEIYNNLINAAGVPPGFLGNQPASILNNPWTPQNKNNATTQEYSTSFTPFLPYFYYALFSDASYTNGAFIRLKNASLSWGLPAEWSTKVGFKSLRLYAQGENLITLTPYKGFDPETGAAYPLLRVITIGVKAGL